MDTLSTGSSMVEESWRSGLGRKEHCSLSGRQRDERGHVSQEGHGTLEQKVRSIAFVLPALGYGGMETVFLTIASALASEGWYCQVLPQVIVDDKALERIPSNVRLVKPILHLSDLKHSHLIHQVLALRRQLDTAKAGVVVSAYERTNAVTGFALSLRPLRHRPKWILTVNSDPMRYLSGNRAAGTIKRFLLRVSCRNADDAVADSPTMAQKATLVYRHSFSIIPNAVAPPASDDSVRVDLLPFCDDGHPVAVYVGRLVKDKRVDDLIHAVSMLGRNSRVRLLVIGDGEDRERLVHITHELGLSGSTFFSGFVVCPWPYLRQLQNAVLVLPSVSEGFGMVLAEAMSSGIPVISSSFDGVQDLLTDDYNGMLVPIGDVKALSRAITLVTTDRERATRLATNGLASVKRFDLAVVLRIWLEHLDGLRST